MGERTEGGETIAEMLARIAALEEANADVAKPKYRRSPSAAGARPRTVRVTDDLWLRAMTRADERGESLSEAIRRFLERYSRGA